MEKIKRVSLAYDQNLILDGYTLEVQPCLADFHHSLKDKHWIRPVGLYHMEMLIGESSSEAFACAASVWVW